MEDKAISYQTISNVPDSVWDKLSKKVIYFGHQSVGYNIVEGLKQIVGENPKIKLKIKEVYDPTEFKSGDFVHSRIGYNEDPASKIDMFSFFVRSGVAEKADIIFFKFCYVDFNENTDVKELFQRYQAVYSGLKTRYPQAAFIHLTVPLTTLQHGLKASLKSILGKTPAGVRENRKRHEFNEMLRKAYHGKEPFFDLAEIESTFPDGHRSIFQTEGQTYYSLVPDYTDDGGHLNASGRKLVAEKLLLTIVESL